MGIWNARDSAWIWRGMSLLPHEQTREDEKGFQSRNSPRTHFRLATPLARLGDKGTILFKLCGRHHPIVLRGARAVLARDTGQERHEIVRVGAHVIDRGAPRELWVGRLVRRDEL